MANKEQIETKQNKGLKLSKKSKIANLDKIAFKGCLSPFRMLMIEISKVWRNEPNTSFIKVRFAGVEISTWIKIAEISFKIIKAFLRLNKAK